MKEEREKLSADGKNMNIIIKKRKKQIGKKKNR